MRKAALALVCVSCTYTIVQGTEGEFTATADVVSTSGSSSAGSSSSGSNSAESSSSGSSSASSAGSSGQPTTGPDPGSSSSTGSTTEDATTSTTGNDASSSTGPVMLPCGGNFSQEWCPQLGPVDQYTRCEAVLNDGKTCLNPEIRYGSVEGGIPVEYPNADLGIWCMQLGFAGLGAVEYGSRDCSQPRGQVFGCNVYDDKVWHWCDYKDGYWRDQKLDFPCPIDAKNLIVSITCV